MRSKKEIEDEKVKLYYNPEFKKSADYFVGKANALAAVFTYLPEIKDIKIIGVESEKANAMELSIKEGKIVPYTSNDTIADGIAGDNILIVISFNKFPFLIH